MEETKPTRLYRVLLNLTKLATVGGILTLFPWKSASFPNVMGYKSLCTFAPAATLYCFLIAGTICFLRSTLVKDTEGTIAEKFKRHLPRLLPLFIVLILAIGSTLWFTSVKSQYTDAASSASVVSE